MDVAVCAATALVGKFAYVHIDGILPESTALSRLSSPAIFGILFSAQYALVKAYRLLVYPYLRSPLRSLPGPKVCSSSFFSYITKHYHPFLALYAKAKNG